MDKNAPHQQLSDLFQTITNIIERLKTCKRWGNYPEKKIRQTSLEHSYSIALLGACCLEIEHQAGKHRFHAGKMITLFLLHDWCEGVIGDVQLDTKKDPRICFCMEKKEREETIRIINTIPFISSYLLKAFALTDKENGCSQLEQEFFDAIEQLDYVLYALNEFLRYNNKEFITVLANQHQALKVYARKFPSIKLLYSPQFQKWVEVMIEENKQHLRRKELPQPTQEHLNDVTQAVDQLIKGLAKGNKEKENQLRQQVARQIDPDNTDMPLFKKHETQ